MTLAVQSAAHAHPTGWITATDYAVVIYARPDNSGRTAGRYARLARDGRKQQMAAHHDAALLGR